MTRLAGSDAPGFDRRSPQDAWLLWHGCALACGWLVVLGGLSYFEIIRVGVIGLLCGVAICQEGLDGAQGASHESITDEMDSVNSS